MRKFKFVNLCDKVNITKSMHSPLPIAEILSRALWRFWKMLIKTYKLKEKVLYVAKIFNGIWLNGLSVARLSRMVPELAWTMFGMKLVRYCLYMWLPMYLNQNVSLPLVCVWFYMKLLIHIDRKSPPISWLVDFFYRLDWFGKHQLGNCKWTKIAEKKESNLS